MTEKYTIDYHLQTFENMAKKLSGHIDRCIFSFVEMYKKLAVNMPELKPITKVDKITLAKSLGEIARKYNIHLQTCATNGDYQKFGIYPSGCMTLDILGNANNVKFKNLKHKGMRENCNCIETRDIGWYDTCPKGNNSFNELKSFPFGGSISKTVIVIIIAIIPSLNASNLPLSILYPLFHILFSPII